MAGVWERVMSTRITPAPAMYMMFLFNIRKSVPELNESGLRVRGKGLGMESCPADVGVYILLVVAVQEDVARIAVHQLQACVVDDQRLDRDAAQDGILPFIGALLQLRLKLLGCPQVGMRMDLAERKDLQSKFHP